MESDDADTARPSPTLGRWDGLPHGEITHRIIGAFFHVYNRLGYGFAETVYRKVLAKDLVSRGLHVAEEAPIEVRIDGDVVGVYRADLLVANRVICELKATERLSPTASMQLLNCLRATDLEVGLLLHFGPSAAFQRIVAGNDRKHRRTDPR